MTRFYKILLALGLFLGTTAPAFATIHIVDCTGGGGFLSIGAVPAVDGDTILVRPCVYNESVSIVGLNRVSLIAADPALTGDFPTGVGAVNLSPVVIDGSGTGGPCVRISGGSNVTISGFRMNNCDTYGIISEGFGINHAFHGNLIVNAAINCINDAGGGTRITGNLVALCDQAGIFLENTRDGYVADNRSLFNAGAGIFVFGDVNHIVNNQSANNGLEGIVVNGFENRIERNTPSGNGGVAQLLIDLSSTNADVVGNETGGSVTDNGAGTELADNT